MKELARQMETTFLTPLLQRPEVWGAVCAGLCLGLLFLKSWLWGAAAFAVLGVAVVAVRAPMLCWKGTTLIMVVVANYVPAPYNTPLFWGPVLLFLAACWVEISDNKLPPRAVLGQWFWGVAIAWVFWAFVCAVDTMDISLSMRAAFRYLLSFTCFFTYLNWIRTSARISEMVRWWLTLAAAMAAFCSVEFFLQMVRGAGIESYLFLGPYPPTHTELALYSVTGIPILIGLWLYRPGAFGWPQRIALALMCVAVGWSDARASYLTALIAGMMMLWKFSNRRFWQMMVLAGVVGVAALITLQARHGDLVAGLMSNLSGRPRIWAAALEAVRQSPIFGIGTGCWSPWFSENFVAADFILFDTKGNSSPLDPYLLGGEAHNLFLSKAAEMGLPSLFLTVMVVALWWRAARRALGSIPEGWFHVVAYGSFAAVCGMVLGGGLFENAPFIGSARDGQVLIVWFMAALPLVIARAFKDGERPEEAA